MKVPPFLITNKYTTKIATYLSKSLEDARERQANLERQGDGFHRRLKDVNRAVTGKKGVAKDLVRQLRDIPDVLRRARIVRDSVRDTLLLVDGIDLKLPSHLQYSAM
jgi:ABC-type transporter Mla subunit MlaD